MKEVQITRTGAKLQVALVIDNTSCVIVFDSPTLEMGTYSGSISDDEVTIRITSDGSFEVMSETAEYSGIPGTLPRDLCAAWIAYVDAGRPDSITITGEEDPGATGGKKKKRRQTRRRRA